MPPRSATPSKISSPHTVWIVVTLSGIVAAMHVWKLPGAMNYIRADLDLTLIAAGSLLGIVQAAAMLLGLSSSILAERIGLRTTLLVGMMLVAIGSILGAFSIKSWHLMATRGLEGIGFLLVTLVGPPLIRRHAETQNVDQAMGWWAAFQGIAAFLAVLLSTLLLSAWEIVSWNTWWTIMGIITLTMTVLVALIVPINKKQPITLLVTLTRISRTVRTLMPWTAATIFSCYTLQWAAIIGFLPLIFSGPEGISTHTSADARVVIIGVSTAVIGGLNGVGSVVGGQLLKRGTPPRVLVCIGYGAIILTTLIIFAPDWSGIAAGLWVQLIAAGIFSGISAFVPASITRIAVDAAPTEGSPSAVMGLMVQVYNAATFVGPILLTTIATASGGWHFSWIMTIPPSLIGIGLAIYFLRTPWLQAQPAPVAR